MTGHELAQKLLTMPNLPVWGMGVGQGSGEGSDAEITGAFAAGQEPDYFRGNNWIVSEYEIMLTFFPLKDS